ncbi:MAG: nitroreductase [Novosphingobium sp.]
MSMSVTEAVTSRRSIRAFHDRAVDSAVLRRVLETAQRAPSGGNTQPWNAVVLTGEPLAKLLAKVAEVLPQGRAAFAPEYNVYPPELEGRYEASRFGVGEAMYAALQIPREDKMSRLAWFARNFQAFGAPVLMLVHTPKYMGPPQWSDIGMWLQSVALLLREEGLDSCFQEAWAVYSKQIRECVAIPDDHVFFCGVAIGWGDREHAVNQFPVARGDLDEAVRWEGFA